MRHHSLAELISDEQEANLRKLAAYLLTLPEDYPDFEMASYAADGSSPQKVSCGTAACAVGHGPMAGVIPLPEEVSWLDYAERAFMPNNLDYRGNPYWWLFGGVWSETDNTVHGAAKRILWTLRHGVPDDADAQREGDAPLCYTDMVLA